MPRVVVVGGGPAGLVAARRLATAGIDVQLFEREDVIGGRVRSRTVEGFTLDRGFQVLFTAYPTARLELDFEALDLRHFSPGAVIARPGSRATVSDPFRDPASLLESALTTELTVGDKLRVLKLRRELRGTSAVAIFGEPDVTTHEFLTSYGFSANFVERFAAPFYGGISLDRRLETSSRVFRYTFAMLSSGRAAVPAGGMGTITTQLSETATAAGVQIETGMDVDSIDTGADSVDTGADSVDTGSASTDTGSASTDIGGASIDAGDEVTIAAGGKTVTADAVVVATDPPTARELTAVESIPTEARGCVTQHYALDGPELDAGRKLLLNAVDGSPNHVVQLSAVAPAYAPAGQVLLSATFLESVDASDEELCRRTRDALSAWYPARSFADLRLIATDRIPFAQFAQPPGIHDTLPGVRAAAGPVYLAGEYTTWSSIEGALASGRAAARAVTADLLD